MSFWQRNKYAIGGGGLIGFSTMMMNKDLWYGLLLAMGMVLGIYWIAIAVKRAP